MQIYQILVFFIIYSFLGWCVEVAYHAVTLGKVVNRGFLNGPVCPVYGFGMLAILLVFDTIEADMRSSNGIALFLGGMALTTLIELFAGWTLDKLFHARWWDYSRQPFNFHGYICLKFSLIWGLGTVFMYRIVHPALEIMPLFLYRVGVGWILLAAVYLVFVIDLCVTVATVRGMNRDLEELDRIRKKLRIVSDAMSEQIGEGTLRTVQMIDEEKVQAALVRKEFKDLKEKEREELAARYEEARRRLYSHPFFGAGRLAKAFPGAVHQRHNELLSLFREKLEQKDFPK